MKNSDSLAFFLPAFLKSQEQITFAVKDAVNPHLKSKYADLPAVIDAIKSALNANGIVFMQAPGETSEMHLRLVTRLLHTSGEWIESELTMPIVKNDPQGFGSALTYARRYALAAITGLYQDDDDGNNATKQKAKKTISGTDGAFDALDSKIQHRIIGIRDEIESLINEGREDEAFTLYGTVNETEEKIALWSTLNSKARSSIKKIGEINKLKT